ncbi:MAG: NRDE family protein [Thermodesulfobacteriota bacterium]|nr:NRDE family protein [Thermodesulfobacteriota bacterium]
MCLILIAFESHPAYKLILAANRDEYYERPTAPACFWGHAPGVLAGRDLRGGGTWLGVTTKGKVGSLTNFRAPSSYKTNASSRGELLSNFLLSQESPVDYLEKLEQKAEEYNGFNLIIGQMDELYWYSNRSDGRRKLAHGIYGLSNHLLDTPWPKVIRGRGVFQRLLSGDTYPAAESIFDMLSDCWTPDDEGLPDTGVGIEWERILSPIFVSSPTYGTRSSTSLSIDLNDRVTYIERTFDSRQDNATTVKYEFQIEP